MLTWPGFLTEMRTAVERSQRSPLLRELAARWPSGLDGALYLERWQRDHLRYWFNPSLVVGDFELCRSRGWSDCGSAAAICAAAARLVEPSVQLRVCYEDTASRPGYAHAKLLVGPSGYAVDVWREFALDVRTCSLTGAL